MLVHRQNDALVVAVYSQVYEIPFTVGDDLVETHFLGEVAEFPLYFLEHHDVGGLPQKVQAGLGAVDVPVVPAAPETAGQEQRAAPGFAQVFEFDQQLGVQFYASAAPALELDQPEVGGDEDVVGFQSIRLPGSQWRRAVHV